MATSSKVHFISHLSPWKAHHRIDSIFIFFPILPFHISMTDRSFSHSTAEKVRSYRRVILLIAAFSNCPHENMSSIISRLADCLFAAPRMLEVFHESRIVYCEKAALSTRTQLRPRIIQLWNRHVFVKRRSDTPFALGGVFDSQLAPLLSFL